MRGGRGGVTETRGTDGFREESVSPAIDGRTSQGPRRGSGRGRRRGNRTPGSQRTTPLKSFPGPRTPPLDDPLREVAAQALGVPLGDVIFIKEKDPWNSQNWVSGYASLVDASLFMLPSKTLLFGWPNALPGAWTLLQQDYRTEEKTPIIMDEFWGGYDIMFLKYEIGERFFVTIRPSSRNRLRKKNSFFLQESDPVFDIVYREWEYNAELRDFVVSFLMDKKVQSVAFAVIDFEPDIVFHGQSFLQPLFLTYSDGVLFPIGSSQTATSGFPSNICRQVAASDLLENESYRDSVGLVPKYREGCFKTKGTVLYTLNPFGVVDNREFYYMVPDDVESIELSGVSEEILAQVREMSSVCENVPEHGPLDPSLISDLRAAVKMTTGELEWNRFGEKVISAFRKMCHAVSPAPETDDSACMILMIGPPGSLKTEFARGLASSSKGRWVIVSYDDYPDAHDAVDAALKILSVGQNVIVDRMNIDVVDREKFIQAAKSHNSSRVFGVWCRLPFRKCAKAVFRRESRFSWDKALGAVEEVYSCFSKILPPFKEEGFERVLEIKAAGDVSNVVNQFLTFDFKTPESEEVKEAESESKS